MICTFIGHRDTPNSLMESIRKAIIELINNGIKDFYVGNNGSFDFLVQTALAEISKTNSAINCRIVLSCINEVAISGNQELTVFPEELSSVPKRFAISKRNEYLLKKSSVIICYVNNTFSNSYKYMEKARRKGLTVIRI